MRDAWVVYFDTQWRGYGPMAVEAALEAKHSLRLSGFTSYAVPHSDAVKILNSIDPDRRPEHILSESGEIKLWSDV